MNGRDLELLERFIAGELSREESVSLESRLAEEPELARTLEQVRDADRLLQRIASSGAGPNDEALPEIDGLELHREIHRGGQGVVYAGTQRSTGRRVAVKVLLRGRFASRRQRYRFEREIELASQLRHPGIVTPLDGGETAEGLAYLVMDMVDGVPLDVYVRTHQCGSARILTLIAETADAVAAAHQRAVIHRDIKPSNVLIDDDGRPHVLDFGLAKALDDAPERVSLATHDGEFMGTLAYASPEQVERGAAAADVRSDVYALGVVAYELLTGSLPYRTDGPLSSVIERVRHEEPPPPSNRCRGLDRDADAVLLSAMAKDPDRRYDSAAAFASDLRRVLAHEPVVARRASTLYQLRKFAQRHRTLVGAATFALIALLVVTATVSIALVRVESARQRTEQAMGLAQDEAAKQRLLSGFLNQTLASVEPGRSGADMRVVELLADMNARIDAELADQPILASTVHATLGTTNYRLGRFEDAERHLLTSIDLLEPLEGRDAAIEHASRLGSLASVYQSMGRLEDAERLYRESIERRRELDSNSGLAWARVHQNLATLLHDAGRFDEAEAVFEELFASGLATGPEARSLRAVALANYGSMRKAQDRWDEALEAYDEALAILIELRGPEHPETIACRNNRTDSLIHLERFEEAEAELRTLIDLRRRVYGDGHESTAVGLNNLADFLRERGRLDEAEPLFVESLAAYESIHGEEHVRTAIALNNLGTLRLDQGRPGAALPLLERAVNASSGSLPDGHWLIDWFDLQRARALSMLGRHDEAIASMRSSRDALGSKLGAGHARVERAETLLAEARERARPDEPPAGGP